MENDPGELERRIESQQIEVREREVRQEISRLNANADGAEKRHTACGSGAGVCI